ncbi:OPT superfamily oligopeptide transporter [Thozetella sp. PMI_491]|nr:OPT superfamily oligopeptide transporter [Thozetella sp. PMI_491]
MGHQSQHYEGNGPRGRQETDSLLSSAGSEEDAKDREPPQEKPERDPYRPFPPIEGLVEQENPLTFRAIFLGILFGTLVNAAEVYSGLKSGLAAGAAMFAPMIGYIIIKGLVKIVPHINWLGGPYGPRETAIVAATASAAAGSASIFTGIVPAMFKLNLLTSVTGSFPPLLVLTLTCTLGGLFSAAPLRNFFIVRSARELKLRFPAAEAMAITVRSLHAADVGAKGSAKQFKAMIIAFALSLVQKIAAQYAKGIVYDWHFFTWIFEWSNYSNQALAVENWGWFLELSPQYWGMGMLVGLNMGASLFFGAVLAYGIIGPILVHTKVCALVPLVPNNPQWKDYMSYSAAPNSPYMWFVFPGISMILFSAFSELALQLPAIWKGFKVAAREASQALLQKFHHRSTHYDPYDKRLQQSVNEDETVGKDVPVWLWVGGMAVIIAVACINSQFQWQVNPGYMVLALLLSCFLAFLNIYGEGTTGFAPPISDLLVGGVFGALVHSVNEGLTTKYTLVFLSSIVVTGVAGVANGLIGDYRNGYLLGVPPRAQFYAQAIGTVASGLSATGLFVLFAEAYPCLLSAKASIQTCTLSAPQSIQSLTLTPAIVQGDFSSIMLPGSGYAAIVFGIIAVVSNVIRHFVLRGEREKYKQYMPNWLAVGMAFVLQGTVLATSLFFGSLVAYVWSKKWPAHWVVFGIAIAAGMMAGEGIGGLIGAILDIAKVGSTNLGIGAGCPANMC